MNWYRVSEYTLKGLAMILSMSIVVFIGMFLCFKFIWDFNIPFLTKKADKVVSKEVAKEVVKESKELEDSKKKSK